MLAVNVGYSNEALNFDATKFDYCGKSTCSTQFLTELKKAESGNPNAQNHVGEILHFGKKGVPQNYLAAKYWYMKATDNGHKVAPNHLGRLYLNGEGVTKDEKEACKWYKVSADRGDKAGKANLAACKL